MWNLTTILMFAALPVLLGMSGSFSGSETALFSLTQHQRHQLRRSRSVVAQAATALLADTRGLLITLMLGNMLANVTYFVISTVLLIRAQDYGASGVVVTLLSVAPLLAIILLGEVLPKLVAARATEQWTTVFALPMLAIHRLIAPLRAVLGVAVIDPLARLIAPTRPTARLSARELGALLELSADRGVIAQGEQQILQQVLLLSQVRVKDIMTPRVDIAAYDLADEPETLVRLLRETRRSRVPVCRGGLDNIVGVARARRVLVAEPKSKKHVRALTEPVRFVPEMQRADQLLVDLRRSGDTFAIVVDEYGGTEGVVTLEDVVELLVGDISGPLEEAEGPSVVQADESTWRVRADLSTRLLADVLGHAGQPTHVRTIGGLVMARLGRLPVEGDTIDLGNVAIRVETMAGLRMEWLELRVTGEPDADPLDDGGTP